MIIDNPLMKGARGRLSGVSFRQADGKTVVQSLPKRRKRRKVSEAQEATHLNSKVISMGTGCSGTRWRRVQPVMR